MYKLLLILIPTCEILFWQASNNFIIKNLQAFQSISFRTITNAPWYLSNRTLHNDNITSISDQESKLDKLFHKKLHHSNPLILNLFFIELPDKTRRLKGNIPETVA